MTALAGQPSDLTKPPWRAGYRVGNPHTVEWIWRIAQPAQLRRAKRQPWSFDCSEALRHDRFNDKCFLSTLDRWAARWERRNPGWYVVEGSARITYDYTPAEQRYPSRMHYVLEIETR